MTSKVSSRYAKAIFDYMQESADSAMVADELEAVGRLIEGNREARFVLVFGVVPVEKRKQVVEDLAVRMKLSQGARRALVVLTEAGRLKELRGVADKLRGLVSAKLGVTLLHVKAAEELGAGVKANIEDRFSKVLNTKVEARYTVDPSVMGGLKVTASGRTFDGSVAGMLGAIQEQFVRGEMQ